MRLKLMCWIARKLGYRQFYIIENDQQLAWAKHAHLVNRGGMWGKSIYHYLPKWLRKLGGV